LLVADVCIEMLDPSRTPTVKLGSTDRLRSAACGYAKRTRVTGVVLVVVMFTGRTSSSVLANPEHGRLDRLGWT